MAELEKEYVVGSIRATNRPGSSKGMELDNTLPHTIRLINLNMNFTRGSEEEFGVAMPAYETKVAELAALGTHLIRPGGAPPFMLLGFAGEREIIRDWEKKYHVPILTSGQNHVRALRTFRVKKFIGASYFPEKLNSVFARYFTDAGVQVLSMQGMKVPFADVPKLPPAEIYDYIRQMVERHPDAEAIYMLGSAWKTLQIIDQLEQTLGVPVIHPSPARCWETQLRLGFRQPVRGYGRLLAEMPDAAAPVS